MSDRGSDAKRVGRLHTALVDLESTGRGAQFAFCLVELARATGVQAYFVAVDAPYDHGIRGSHLAASIGHYGRFVVFDRSGKSHPANRRLRVLTDETATAVFVGERAAALLARGEVERSLDQFEFALRFDPRLAWAWSGMGEALRRQGERDRAMDAYERALALAAAAKW